MKENYLLKQWGYSSHKKHINVFIAT